MKLLFIQDALNHGGAERSHLEILSRFSEEVDVGLVYFYAKHHLKDEYERAGIQLFFLNIPESYNFHTAIYRLIRLIRQEKPDLLVSCLWRADIISRMASRITGVPLVGTLVNDSYSPLAWKTKRGFKHRLVYWLDKYTAGIPVHFIANSEALATSHVATLRIPRNKITVIYRGRDIPTATWTPRSEIKHFVSYGRLLKRKGFQDLLIAFARVKDVLPENWSLTIFGEGPYRSELERYISELKLQQRVRLAGHVNSPAELLVDYDCFLFPSWYEGFSGALVEAMLVGIPIIASDIPMNLEAVSHEETALIFAVNDPYLLADQLKVAIDNPDRMAMLGIEARKKAIEKFSIVKIAREYEGQLKSIVGAKGEGR